MKSEIMDAQELLSILIETRNFCRECEFKRSASAIQTALHLALLETRMQEGALQWVQSESKSSIIEDAQWQRYVDQQRRSAREEVLLKSVSIGVRSE